MKKMLFLIACVALALGCASPAGSNHGTTTPSYTAIGGTAPLAESMLSFAATAPVAARGIVNRFDHTIKLYFPSGTVLTSVARSYQLAAGVNVSSVSPGTDSSIIDLTSSKTYNLSDGSSYVVSASTTEPSAATVNTWLSTGINLGNDLDAWPEGEGFWTNNVVAQKYCFDDYKKMGFSSVRIPITWGEAALNPGRVKDSFGNRLPGASPYIINPAFLDRVETLVGWALDAGLTVVINAHHEDWIRTLNDASYPAQMPRFQALWTQIAERFKSYPPQLVFEILNEPQGAMTNPGIKAVNAAILPIIRANNPNRVVIVGANSYNSVTALQAPDFGLPNDGATPHLIATFHNYNPWTFAGQSSGSWGSALDIQNMTRDLNNVQTWAASKSVPLYMGEYGVTLLYQGKKTDLTSRTAWYRSTSALARARGISMVIWDDYGDFKIYDRLNRACDHTIIDAVLGQ